jgi:perosamine synthetase
MDQFKDILQFIRELYKQPEGFIPLHIPVFKGKEKEYLEECIDTNFVSSVGKFVDKFEGSISEFTGSKKAVACVNGTNALHLALIMVGVESGTEVITQALTFVATANAIAYCGAQPVFLDVDKQTMGLSPDSLESWLRENTYEKIIKEANHPVRINSKTGRRISACVPMHTFGHPVRIDRIKEICDFYAIPLVEDAAESLGSFFKGQHTGTFGIINVLSFNGNKTLTTGGGGMLLFNDEELARKAKHLTTQAKLPHPWDYVHDCIAYNYRMPNINAALGYAQMEYLNELLRSKREIAEKYKAYFKNTDIQFFEEKEYCSSNYWLNAIIMKDKDTRDKFLQYSNNNGIMTRPTWRLMTKLKMFRKNQRDTLQNSKWLEERVVNIPSSAIL